METANNQAKLLDGVMSIAPRDFISVVLALHSKLGDSVEWALGGDLGEVLRTINLDVDCIEILTSKDGAVKIVEANSEFNPRSIALETQQLSRNAVIEGKEYPVYVRSYYSEFNIGAVKVKVYGDVQYKLHNWDWGDKVEFTPDYVYVVGKKIAVAPLSFKYEFYQSLGWADRADKIRQTLDRRRFHRR